MTLRPKIFLSYAWKDDQPFAKRIYRDLSSNGFTPWMDVHNMPSRGRSLPLEVLESLELSDRVIVIIGPHALSSLACQAERGYASARGKLITPILRWGEYSEIPSELAKLFTLDFRPSRPYRTAFKELLRILSEPVIPPSALMGVPALPANYRLRGQQLVQLRQAISRDELKPVAVLSTKQNIALQGMSGIGKTVLASGFAHEFETRRTFPDGIIWLTVRKDAELINLICMAGSALDVNLRQYGSATEALLKLKTVLEPKACLIMLDDVWDIQLVQEFLNALGPRCRLLLTTRDGRIANKLNAHILNVDRLEDSAALQLLADTAGIRPDEISPEVVEVARECGNLPFALVQCGATIRNGNQWVDLLEALRSADVSYFAEKLPNYDYPDVFRSITSSVAYLEKADLTAATCYYEMAVFPALGIPETALVTLWTRDDRMTAREARKIVSLLQNLSLVERITGQSPNRRIYLHDLQVDYLRAVCIDLMQLHKELVRAYRLLSDNGWDKVPNDGYYFQQLPRHLMSAGRKVVLRKLLLDPSWLKAKLAACGVVDLIRDFDYLSNEVDIAILQGACRLSMQVIAKDTAQFSVQVAARLLPFHTRPRIKQLLSVLGSSAERPLLRLLHPTLEPPQTALMRTLLGHSSYVWCVAITPDGKIAVSGSGDNTVKVWNLLTGETVHTLIGHSDAVYAVALSPNGKIAVSASSDDTVRVWDLESGIEIHTLEGHSKFVGAVTISPDGSTAVSGSGDNTLKIWDLRSGALLRTLRGHSDSVRAVTITPDGRLLLSASADRSIKIWELESGRELSTLVGHTSYVNDLAVTSNGELAVSTSWDRTCRIWSLSEKREVRSIKMPILHPLSDHSALSHNGQFVISEDHHKLNVWDLNNERTLFFLSGHSYDIRGIAITSDDQLVVSASGDHTLKVWDLRVKESFDIPGHRHYLTALDASANGRKAVSVSTDRTLKVWDLTRGQVDLTLEGHHHFIIAVAISPDGRRAISASEDGNEVFLWDLEIGKIRHILRGHSDDVSDVGVGPDGRWAITASYDKTIRLWDLETGTVLRILRGHSSPIEAVAVSADGRRMISISAKIMKIWDLKHYVSTKAVRLKGSTFTAIAAAPVGDLAISGSRDGVLRVWDLESGSELRRLRGEFFPRALAISSNGRWVTATSAAHLSERTLRVWDIGTGEEMARFTVDAPLQDCAFAGESTIIAGDDLGRIHHLALELAN